jgi:enoyl-CoA hydratase/carnithine racemase
MTSADLPVRLEVSDRVATIRLDRPPMNALNTEVRTLLAAAAAECTARSDIGAVVVYGGERTFAAGADIAELAATSYQDMIADGGPLQDALGAMAAVPKPTIAAVTGFALGGGLEIALSCDFRIVSDKARLGVPEIQLGVIPGGGGTQRLARLIGPSRAKDMIFSGRHVRADEALAIGLVDEVVPADDVHATAVARARIYADGPALALRAAKESVDAGLGVDLKTGLAIERAAFAALFATDDRELGMTSFLENGPGKAVFTGR